MFALFITDCKKHDTESNTDASELTIPRCHMSFGQDDISKLVRGIKDLQVTTNGKASEEDMNSMKFSSEE